MWNKMVGFRHVRGPEGECIYTKCGHKESHERDTPCLSKKCPKCSAVMIRYSLGGLR